MTSASEALSIFCLVILRHWLLCFLIQGHKVAATAPGHMSIFRGRKGVGVGERWGKKLVKLILSLSFSLLTNGYVKRYRYTDN